MHLVTVPCALIAVALSAEPFSVDLTAPPKDHLQFPWRKVELPEGWGGQYIVAGDLDADGEVEFVTGRNAAQVMTTVLAVNLDGSILWKWGRKGAGTHTRFYDVPLQIHDPNGDGRPEVFAGVAGEILVFSGSDGTIVRRLPLPDGLKVADCIVFARLTRTDRARDLLVKDRYHRIWALDSAGSLLWRIENPGGYRTAHHPEPFDLDGDGVDEVLAGYSLLDRKGKVLWTWQSTKTDLAAGHLDCGRLLRRGATRDDARLAVSCCGANLLALVDGAGRTQWEIPGRHFESIDVGEVRTDVPGLEIVVDVDHQPYGRSPVWVISEAGEVLGTYNTNYSRYHHLADWNGDGQQDIVLANARRIVDGEGQTLCGLGVPEGEREALLGKAGERSNEAPFLLLGNFAGRGVTDVVLNSHRVIFIYANPSRAAPAKSIPLGSAPNFTLY